MTIADLWDWEEYIQGKSSEQGSPIIPYILIFDKSGGLILQTDTGYIHYYDPESVEGDLSYRVKVDTVMYSAAKDVYLIIKGHDPIRMCWDGNDTDRYLDIIDEIPPAEYQEYRYHDHKSVLHTLKNFGYMCDGEYTEEMLTPRGMSINTFFDFLKHPPFDRCDRNLCVSDALYAAYQMMLCEQKLNDDYYKICIEQTLKYDLAIIEEALKRWVIYNLGNGQMPQVWQLVAECKRLSEKRIKWRQLTKEQTETGFESCMDMEAFTKYKEKKFADKSLAEKKTDLEEFIKEKLFDED